MFGIDALFESSRSRFVIDHPGSRTRKRALINLLSHVRQHILAKKTLRRSRSVRGEKSLFECIESTPVHTSAAYYCSMYNCSIYAIHCALLTARFLILHFVLAEDASDGIRESNDGLPASATVYYAEKENFTQVVWSAEE